MVVSSKRESCVDVPQPLTCRVESRRNLTNFSETRQPILGDCVTYVTFHSFYLTSMSKR